MKSPFNYDELTDPEIIRYYKFLKETIHQDNEYLNFILSYLAWGNPFRHPFITVGSERYYGRAVDLREYLALDKLPSHGEAGKNSNWGIIASDPNLWANRWKYVEVFFDIYNVCGEWKKTIRWIDTSGKNRKRTFECVFNYSFNLTDIISLVYGYTNKPKLSTLLGEWKQQHSKKHNPQRNFFLENINVFSWWDILECQPTDSFDIVHKNYLALSKKYHPDLGGDTAKMQSINNAYDFYKSNI